MTTNNIHTHVHNHSTNKQHLNVLATQQSRLSQPKAVHARRAAVTVGTYLCGGFAGAAAAAR